MTLTSCTSHNTQVLNSSEPLDLTHSKIAAQEYWVAAKLVSPKYPVANARHKIAGCSRFKLSINSNGETVDTELIESYPNNKFVAPSQGALKQWLWTPTDQNEARKAITRLVQLDFYMTDAKNYAQAKRHCAVGTQY